MKLPRDLSGAEAVTALQRLGFRVTHRAGSHVQLAKGDHRVTVPLHPCLAPGTLRSILRQAGIDLESFLSAL